MTATNVVLGLCAFTHDSAAGLLVDGDLVGFAEEERLTGDKHTAAYPARAVAWLLDTAGIGPASVDVVAYNFDGRRYLDALPATELFARMPETQERAQPRADSFRKVHDRFTARMTELRSRFPRARMAPVLHHRAHGLYAFASSEYDAAAVLVVDSLGEVQSTTIGSGLRLSNGDCRTVIAEDITDPASLGYAYGAVTEHLGWRRGDEEGTVMALAALGDPGRFRPLMREAIVLTERGLHSSALVSAARPHPRLPPGQRRVRRRHLSQPRPRRPGGARPTPTSPPRSRTAPRRSCCTWLAAPAR